MASLLLWAAALWGSRAAALHVAFVVPPGSPMGPMMPVVHGCLDAGHEVSLLAYDAFRQRLQGMAPKANFVGLGPTQRPEMDETKASFIFSLPYGVLPLFANMAFFLAIDPVLGGPLASAALPAVERLRPDVLCVTNVLGSTYLVGEKAGIPTVGIAWGPQSWMTTLDMPWSLDPTLGTWYTGEELAQSFGLMTLNVAYRCVGLFARAVGLLLHNRRRLLLGLSSLQFSQYESMFANPLIVPSLPELSGGFPYVNSPYAVSVGMYDHPALDGASMGKSEQHLEIMGWLDKKQASGTDVLYVAFGSEIILDRERIDSLIKAFDSGNLAVLWALKKPPKNLQVPPGVWVTPWSPQKAVLGHPAVKGFLSHGGGNSVREAVSLGTPMLIMPVMPDGPTVAAIHEELGVALRLDKFSITPEAVVGGFQRLCTQEFQARAKRVKELNDKHASLARAVEVIENAATGAFPRLVRRGPGIFAPVGAIFLVFLVASGCLRCCRCLCSCCCCCFRRPSKEGTGKRKHE